jgi:hypothetical protein
MQILCSSFSVALNRIGVLLSFRLRQQNPSRNQFFYVANRLPSTMPTTTRISYTARAVSDYGERQLEQSHRFLSWPARNAM